MLHQPTQHGAAFAECHYKNTGRVLRVVKLTNLIVQKFDTACIGVVAFAIHTLRSGKCFRHASVDPRTNRLPSRRRGLPILIDAAAIGKLARPQHFAYHPHRIRGPTEDSIKRQCVNRCIARLDQRCPNPRKPTHQLHHPHRARWPLFPLPDGVCDPFSGVDVLL